ncbi:MAG: sigma-E processing peptidase SpoIIGA [Oscillospiraceae bacterium]|jgi:stage II sporulation protein GA (sporulation sigma-E factor processing peptidase)
MEIIYVDILFFINLIINYFILLATGRICALMLRRWRYALAAALGAAYSVMVVVPSLGFLASAPMKLVLAGFMALVAYGGERNLARCTITFLAVSAAFGGAVWAASMLGGLPRGDTIYVPVSLRVLVLSFALCYGAVSLVFRRAARRSERELLRLAVAFQGRSLNITALRDTGNELYDPISGAPVLVAEKEAVMPLFRQDVAACLKTDDPAEAMEALAAIPRCRSRFRLIPFTSVGMERSLLLAFRPDSLTVNGESIPDALVALSPTRICEDGEYAAIL